MGAAAVLIPALLQGMLGAAQYFGGRKMAKTPTPAYQIPQAVNQAVDTQRRYAQGEMPGMSAMRQAQSQTTANAFENLGKFGMIDPNTASSIYGQERGVLGDIGLAGTRYELGEKDKYLNALGILAGEQNKQWNWNIGQPFERKMADASSLMGAGIQNVWGGVSSAGDYMMQREMLESLDYEVPSMFGNMFNKEQTNFNYNPLEAIYKNNWIKQYLNKNE